MLRVAQECFTRPLGSEHARFAFDAEVGLEAAGASNEADNELGEVDVEIVADNVRLALGAALLSKWRRNRAKSFSVRVLPITPSTAPVATSKAAIKSLESMTAVLKLAPFHLARHHRQTRCDAFRGLNAGHLVDGDRAMAVIGAGGGLVDPADVRTFVVEGGVRFGGQTSTRTRCGFRSASLLKKRPTRAREMLWDSPRQALASSAISRWLQWRSAARFRTASRTSSPPPRISVRA